MGFITDLIRRENPGKMDRAELDYDLQTAEISFYMTNRKAYKTEEERALLAKDTGFTIVGDPIGEHYNDTKMHICQCNKCGWRKQVPRISLVRKTIECRSCIYIRYKEEAQEKNMTLLGFSGSGKLSRLLYRFNDCQHTIESRAGDVKNQRPICQVCLEQKLQESCDKSGVECLGNERRASKTAPLYVDIRYKDCNHVRSMIKLNLLHRGADSCSVCYEDNLKAKVEDKFGIRILGKVKGTKRLIRFDSCGHEKVVTLSNMKRGIMMCQECENIKYAEEAKEVGLTWCGPAYEYRSDGKHLHRYMADCGHQILRAPPTIRTGHWTCRECNSGYLQQPNKLYIFKVTCSDGFEFLKFGYSKVPKYRKYDYKSTKDVVFELIKEVEIETGAKTITIENSLHAKYKTYNLDKNKMKDYLTESGFTECYPIELLENFVKDLEEIENNKDKNDKT